MKTQSYTLPLLPLSKDVLFPFARLPLYIYEMRYISLLRDCIHADQRLGLALLKAHSPEIAAAQPDRSATPHPPRVHRVVTVGRIIDFQQRPEGNFEALVEGVERARVVEEVPHEPYRAALLKPLGDCYDTLPPEALRETFRELTDIVAALIRLLPNRQRLLRRILHTDLHPSIVADQLAFHLIPDAYDKWCILHELDVGRRVRLVTVQLRTLLRRLSSGAKI